MYHICSSHIRQKKALYLLELDFQAVVNPLIWELETKLLYSGIAASAFNF